MPRVKVPQGVRAPVKPVGRVGTEGGGERARTRPAAGGEGPGRAEVERLVEEACEFILERKRGHAASIAWEVGEHLFERTFRGDVGYLESKDRNKVDSLKEIAERTGIHRVRLASWVRAYVAKKYLEPAGIDPGLSMTEFEALRPLIGHPAAARAALEVRDRLGLTAKQLDALVVSWRRRLDEGGEIGELLERRPVPSTVRVRERRGHKDRVRGRRPDLTIVRLLRLVLRWLEGATLAAPLRGEIEGRLRRLRERLVSAGGVASGGEGGGVVGVAPSPVVVAGGEVIEAGGGEEVDEAGMVAAAVAFIEGRLRDHTLTFAMEVGRYLFERVYGGDRGLFHSGGHRWQVETIRRIAEDERVGLGEQFLYRAIHVYLLRERVAGALGSGEVLPELPVSAWNALWPLEGEVEVLLPVARWAEEEGVSVRELRDVASLVGPYVAAGGRLEDLMVSGGRRGRDTPYRRILRMLDVLDTLISRHPPSPPVVSRCLSLLPS